MTDAALSVKRLAELLGIRRHGVLALIHSGELRGFDASLKPTGRALWRVLAEDLDGFILRRTYQPAAPRRRRRKPQATMKRYF